MVSLGRRFRHTVPAGIKRPAEAAAISHTFGVAKPPFNLPMSRDARRATTV